MLRELRAEMRGRRAVFRKRRREFCRQTRAQGVAVGIDELRRAAAAEYIRLRHALMRGDGRGQRAAVGIRILPHLCGRGADRLDDAWRRAERMDIGGKIERDGGAVDVAAMRILRVVEHRLVSFVSGYRGRCRAL